MAGPKVPDGWVLEGQPLASSKTVPKVPDGWELEAPAPQQAAPIADAGSPLEKALTEQGGDVVTVQTPTGPAQFTRSGARFYGPEEAAQIQEAGGAKLKERALEGGLSVLSGGGPMVDELAGVGSALKSLGTDEKFGDAYRRGRDQTRIDVNRATRNASPTVSVGDAKIPVLPALGAAVPSMLAPLPLGWLGRIASSAVQGGEAAAGATDADLTQGETKRFLAEVGKGAGIGAIASGGAEVLAAPVRYVGRQAGLSAADALERVTAATQATKDKALQGATSKLGGISMGQMASVKNAIQVIENPSLYPPAAVQEARRLLQSPEGQSLMAQAAANNTEKFFTNVPRELEARAAMGAAQTAAQPAAVAGEVAAKTAPEAIVGDVFSKGWSSIGRRAALGAAGGALGAIPGWLTDNDTAKGAGSMLGAGVMINPGVLRFLEKQAASPVVQYGANAAMSNLVRQGTGAAASVANSVAPAIQATRPDPLEKERQAIQAFISGG